MHASSGADHENLNENIDPYFQQRRCSPMILVSGNIMFIRIFAGVPWTGDVKRQWGNRKHGFSGHRTLHQIIGQHCYILFSPLSPFHWPQNTWPWVTLNGLKGHFTLNFHYYKLPLSNLLLIYCRVCLHMWPAEKCGKQSSGPWSAEYLESAEKLRIFRIDAIHRLS